MCLFLIGDSTGPPFHVSHSDWLYYSRRFMVALIRPQKEIVGVEIRGYVSKSDCDAKQNVSLSNEDEDEDEDDFCWLGAHQCSSYTANPRKPISLSLSDIPQAEMKGVGGAALIVLLIVAAQIPFGLTLPSTVPAFLWSPHQHESLYNGLEETVNYRTISPKDLAKSVLTEGGWSKFMCSGENTQSPVDVALVFVGRELQSSDISRNTHEDTTLMNLLKDSFTSSNFSRAFPYVAASREKETMESSLLSGFTETCAHGLGVNNIAFTESCSVEDGNYRKLADMHSVHDYLISRMENRQKGQTDLIVLCNGDSHSSEEFDQTSSEGHIMSKLIGYMEQLGASYSVLYASDSYRSTQYPSFRDLDRFLAEGTVGNGSANATFCDGVCQIKSSLLEGVLVGIVLLIILISGLCCMMGIDTPTRFETPQDS